MKRPSDIVILYNPKSTGSGKDNSYALKRDLSKLQPSLGVHIRGTTHAGHAEEIAANYAAKRQSVLIVSSSGDGGYNEVINGALSVKGSRVVTHVLPSGNANDHAHATSEGSSAEQIADGKLSHIDVMKITARIDGKPWQRYAHSYIGLGLSPSIGKRLTATDINFFNEKWLVLKYLFRLKHITIIQNNQPQRYSSVLFGNITRMSKFIKLSQDAAIDDGKFEIYRTHRVSPWRLLGILFHATIFELDSDASVEASSFRTTTRLPIQLDGEVYTIDADCEVAVQCEKQALTVIL